MRSFLIIGLGKFGKHLALKLNALGNEVCLVDKNVELTSEMSEMFSTIYSGDCTKPGVLKGLGINNFDMCIVAIGSNFQSSLEITAELKALKAKYICSKANSDIQGKFLTMAGADEIVYPEKDIAYKLAVKFNAKNIFDYIQLGDEYCIYEVAVNEFVGQQIQEINIRNRFNVNILAIKNDDGSMETPSASYIFKNNDHIVVFGEKNNVSKFIKKV